MTDIKKKDNEKVQFLPSMGVEGNVTPALGDIPFRGDPSRYYTKEDVPQTKPQIYSEAKILNVPLDTEEHINRYRRAVELCSNGLGKILVHHVDFDPEEGCYKVLMVYDVFYRETPESIKKRKLDLLVNE